MYSAAAEARARIRIRGLFRVSAQSQAEARRCGELPRRVQRCPIKMGARRGLRHRRRNPLGPSPSESSGRLVRHRAQPAAPSAQAARPPGRAGPNPAGSQNGSDSLAACKWRPERKIFVACERKMGVASSVGLSATCRLVRAFDQRPGRVRHRGQYSADRHHAVSRSSLDRSAGRFDARTRSTNAACSPGGVRSWLRESPDDDSAGCDQSPMVGAEPVRIFVARERRLWAKEVAHVLAEATTLEPDAWAAVRSVLTSLADDPMETPPTRETARTLLTRLEANSESGRHTSRLLVFARTRQPRTTY